MPCDTIQYTEIDASKMQPDILRAALESMGYTVREVGAGRLTFQNGGGMSYGTYQPGGALSVPQGFDGELLTRRYSTELVKAKATRAGWRVTEKADNKLQLTRRF